MLPFSMCFSQLFLLSSNSPTHFALFLLSVLYSFLNQRFWPLLLTVKQCVVLRDLAAMTLSSSNFVYKVHVHLLLFLHQFYIFGHKDACINLK